MNLQYALSTVFTLLVHYGFVHVSMGVVLVDLLLSLLFRSKMPAPRTVLITGASNGMGAALATHVYAKEGVRLALSGRNKDRLAEVARACESRGAKVKFTVLDVTDRDGMEKWVQEADEELGGLDLVIANAGLAEESIPGGAEDSVAVVREVMDMNLGGVLNTILPVIPRMRQRHFGQIVLMSSLAGYMGLPSASAYCASKAAVRTLGEGLRADLMCDGIHVNVISPGFVETHTRRKRNNPLPFLLSLHAAIDIISYGIAHDVPEIAFPWQLVGLASAIAAVPRGVRDFFARFHLLPGLSYKTTHHPIVTSPSASSPTHHSSKKAAPVPADAASSPPKRD